MNNNLSISFLAIAILFFIFYFVFSIKGMDKNSGESLLNTFPFETNKKTKIISLLILLISCVLGALFIVFLYPIEYRFGFQIASMICCIVSVICFFLLNIINFYREKIHFAIFSILFASSLSYSITLGGATYYFYDLLDQNVFVVILSILYFVIAIAEVLYVIPNISATLKLNHEEVSGEVILKKPHFVKLSFLEWLLPIGIFLKSILILVVILLI